MMDLVLQYLIMSSFCSLISATMSLPTLNFSDVEVSDVTNHSALLSWSQELVSKYNSTVELRLFVLMKVSDQPMVYMNPPIDDPYCSIQLSRCHLRFLTPATRYNVELTIDQETSPLGEATVTFITEATRRSVCSKGEKSKSWLLLYIVLPISGGFNFLFIIVMCIFVYRWRKRQGKGQVAELPVTNDTNVTGSQDNQYISSTPSSNDGEPFYTPMNLNSPGNQRFVIPLVQPQASVQMSTTATFSQSQSCPLYENERARYGDSTALYDSVRVSRHNNIAQQTQQQQQMRQQKNGSNKGHNIYVNERFSPPPTAL